MSHLSDLLAPAERLSGQQFPHVRPPLIDGLTLTRQVTQLIAQNTSSYQDSIEYY